MTSRLRAGRLVRQAVLLLMAILTLYPVWFMVSTAFKTQHQYLDNPYAVPWPLSVANFGDAIHGGTFFLWFKNSAILTLGSVILSTLAAALAAFAIGTITGSQVWLAIARTGAWLNLFNLLPIWQLDGNRGLHAVGRAPRWALAAVALVAFLGSGEGLLALVGVVIAVRAFGGDAPESTDSRAFATFAGLLVCLAYLSRGV